MMIAKGLGVRRAWEWLAVLIAVLLLIAGAAGIGGAQATWEEAGGPREIDLARPWLFKGDWLENGLAEGWHLPDYDDSQWTALEVPGNWESQEIETPNPRWPSIEPGDGYNGYAWYRLRVTIPVEWEGAKPALEISGIDDIDWVYLNGKLVGSTTSERAHEEERRYLIPPDAFVAGAENVIAIRILDKGGVGGITSGPVRIIDTAMGAVAGEEAVEERAVPEAIGEWRTRAEIVRFGTSVEVPPNEKVEGDVVVFGGSVTVRGWVVGDVVVFGGSINVIKGGRVDGDAVVMGGKVNLEDGGYLGGSEVQPVPGIGRIPRMAGHFPFTHTDRIGKMIVGFLSWIFIGLLAVLLFRNRVLVMAEALPMYPGRAVGYGLLGTALTPAVMLAIVVAFVVAIVSLVITIVGIIALPAVAIVFVALLLGPLAIAAFGITGVFLSVGQTIMRQFGRPEAAPLFGILVGTAAILLARLIPVIGVFVWLTVVILGFGLALMTGLGGRGDWLHRRLRIEREREEEAREEVVVEEMAAEAGGAEPAMEQGESAEAVAEESRDTQQAGEGE